MSEISNGSARFEDLKSSVQDYFGRTSSLEQNTVRLSERLGHIEGKLDALTAAVERLKEEDSPKEIRQKAIAWAQITMTLLLVVAQVAPHLR